MNKNRGFEKLSTIKANIPLPKRKTAKSAGYDINVIHPKVYKLLEQGMTIQDAWDSIPKLNNCSMVSRELDKMSIILPTGIKAYMKDNEYLSMTIRSSAGIKNGLRQANPTSIIDSDYYNNSDNEGHIMFAVSNDFIIFDEPIMRIAQGVFLPYLIADDDSATGERIGGIGSTGK